ncbi:MAG: hypothetical protein WDZ35_13590 [Crocinitomicaceae bacterium]
MRYLFLSAIIFCVFATYGKGKPDTLKHIKSEYLVSYTAEKVNGKIVKGEREWYLHFLDDEYNEYNKNGDVVKTIYWDEYGNLDEMTVFEFNQDDKLTKFADFIVNEDGDTVMDYMTSFYYDHKGFCYLDSSFNGDYSLNLYSKSAYDYSQNISVSKTLYPDGKMLAFYYQYYNKAKQMIKMENRNKNNQLKSTTHYIRDTVENYYEYYTIVDNDTTSRSRTNYNEQGFSIWETHYFQDRNDVPIEHTFEYEVNEYGDWVKQYIYREGKLEYVVERELTYWD